MLELRRSFRAARSESRDDNGVALVAVLLVMLVGFVIVATIAAAVVFTVGANSGNRAQTQAFVSAESGRDAMISAVSGANCAAVPVSGTSFHLVNRQGQAGYDASKPQYDVTAQTGADPSHLSATCPSAVTAVIQVKTTGYDANGASTAITSNYGWQVQQQMPGGVMTYFSGQFKATKATYTGDLVIRPDPVTGVGNFLCNSGGGTEIDGDLWVLAGNVDLSADCTINGSIYASGTISISASGATVTGDLVAVGGISLTSNKLVLGDPAVPNSGNVYTDGTFDMDKKTTILGKYESGGVATIGAPTAVGKLAKSAQKCATTLPLPANCISGPQAVTPNTPTKTPGTSTFNPTLAQVLNMTQWMDLSATRAGWGTDVNWLTPTAAQCGGADIRPVAMAAPPAGYTKVGIDYTGCSGDVTIKVGNGLITHDAVFLVKPSASMAVDVGTLTTNLPSPYPQLIFLHGDSGPIANHKPECGVASSANDSIDVASSTTVRMMIYTPCGLGMANHISFNGQYYANDDGNARWVWPIFSCAAMKWGPIALGCSVKDEAAAGGGVAPPPTLSLGPLVSQTEP